MKRENRDLMPLQRCRNTASAEVAINEKEDTKTLSCGTNGSPSETFHKVHEWMAVELLSRILFILATIMLFWTNFSIKINFCKKEEKTILKKYLIFWK